MLNARKGIAAVLAAMLATGPAPVAAHPHVFIDTGLEIIFDAEGRLTHVKVTWNYDDLYSLLLAEDYKVDTPGEGFVDIDPECLAEEYEPPDNPWALRVEWRAPYSGNAEDGSRGVITMPAVGNLTDDDGDGYIDDRDVPDIAYTTYPDNTLEIRSGDDGRLLWSRTQVSGTASPAIADIDGDGANEVVAVMPGSDPAPIAFRANGDLFWRGEANATLEGWVGPIVADLDGDYDVEVILDRMIVDGGTGRVVDFLPTNGQRHRHPVVGDIDLDGGQEIVMHDSVYSAQGHLRWRAPVLDPHTVHTAIANVDDDDEGEVIIVAGRVLETYEPDGTRIWRTDLPGDRGGPPCVADFDGDGQVEIGLGIGDVVGVYELDGGVVWEVPSIDDTTAHAGCSGYDFDGDGAYELLHADKDQFLILDGRTGDVLVRDIRHASSTLFEYPVVADVDGDGSAEIVLASNSRDDNPGWAGITVYGHVEDLWAQSGATWGVHDFAVTNLGSDGQVPTDPDPAWLVHNVFRARPNIDSPAAPNLQAAIVDVCVGTCDGGPVKVSVVVSNVGGVPVRVGTPVTLFGVRGSTRIPLQSLPLPAINEGTSTQAIVFELDPDQLEDALIVVVDDDGSGFSFVDECNEDDNEGYWEAPICP